MRNNRLVLGDPLGIHLPLNWERANGYRGQASFIAIWWANLGKTVQIDDACHQMTVYRNSFSDDLLNLVLGEGDDLHKSLGYGDQIASHCLLVDLEARTVYYADLDDAMAWITQRIPSPDETSRLNEREALTDENLCVCPDCGGYGWIHASGKVEDGYIPCPSCCGEE